MIHTSVFRIVALVFFMICGCAFFQAESVYAADAGQKDAVIVLERTNEGYSWFLQTPSKPGVVQVLLWLKDADGNLVPGKKVTGEVLMPQMPMQGYPLKLEFYEEKGGEYCALVQYAHGGLWRITAGFAGDEEQRIQESFDFELKD